MNRRTFLRAGVAASGAAALGAPAGAAPAVRVSDPCAPPSFRRIAL
jgi:hypothetical protein